MYTLTLRCVRETVLAVEEQYVLHIVSLCVSVALGIQHAMYMHHIILSSVNCPALQYCSILSHRKLDFQKQKFV